MTTKELALSYIVIRDYNRPSFHKKELDHWCKKQLEDPKIRQKVEKEYYEWITTNH